MTEDRPLERASVTVARIDALAQLAAEMNRCDHCDVSAIAIGFTADGAPQAWEQHHEAGCPLADA